MTGKQRAYLRKLANGIEVKYQTGKEGVDSDSYTALIDSALEANEIIKIHVLENSVHTAKEACELLCEKTGAISVQVIGRKIVLYRQSVKKQKIVLPE